MIPPRRHAPSYLNQRNFVFAVAGIVLAAIAGFFLYEFKFLRAPSLEISDPAKDMTTSANAFDIHGRSDPDADVTLNGRPLFAGETGAFTERIYPVKGVNRLEFEAKNRYGKITSVTRYLVVP